MQIGSVFSKSGATYLAIGDRGGKRDRVSDLLELFQRVVWPCVHTAKTNDNRLAKGAVSVLIFQFGSFPFILFARCEDLMCVRKALVVEARFRERLFAGYGSVKFRSGAVYKGTFCDGLLDGPNCTVSDCKGSRIEGRFTRGDFVHGSVVYSSGQEELGYFLDNALVHGMRSDGNGNVWSGGFHTVSHRLHGKNCCREYPDGSFEEGIFLDGMLVFGTKVCRDGSWYYGPFKEGLLDGRGGIARLQEGLFLGQFHEGRLNGQGEWRSSDGSHFKGAFRLGGLHGYGEHRLASGEIRVGLFDQNQLIRGTKVLSSGERQEGAFLNNALEGPGKVTLLSGDFYYALFEGGKPQRGRYFEVREEEGRRVVSWSWWFHRVLARPMHYHLRVVKVKK